MMQIMQSAFRAILSSIFSNSIDHAAQILRLLLISIIQTVMDNLLSLFYFIIAVILYDFNYFGEES